MADLSLVPIPERVERAEVAAFALDDEVALVTDDVAMGDVLRAGLRRVGVGLAAGRPATGHPRAITLALAPGSSPEGYRLTVDDRAIRLTAADAAGLFYGVQTLLQTVDADPTGVRVPALHIEDAPRFAYRGAMLDVARHFHDVATVTGYIDRISALKLNVLHLHLSDDQGWRLELHSRPELTRRAAQSDIGGGRGGFFTQDDYRAILAHAASRHVTIVPEFDVPGHTHAVGIAYPRLAAEPVLTDDVREVTARDGGSLPTAGVPYAGLAVGFSSLRMNDPEVDLFLRDVFTELAALTPGPYLHLGGDEAHGTDPDDYRAFLAVASAIVAGTGKVPIAWHDAGSADDLAPGTVGQYWGYTTPIDDAAVLSRRFFAPGGTRGGLILSPSDAVYLDMKYDASTTLGLTWADGPTSVAASYSWDPLEVVPGLEESDVRGVEAPLWTETVATAADIDAMTHPRLAAAAEIAWSPAATAHPDRTWDSFRSRVGGLAAMWRRNGVAFFASPEIPWSS